MAAGRPEGLHYRRWPLAGLKSCTTDDAGTTYEDWTTDIRSAALQGCYSGYASVNPRSHTSATTTGVNAMNTTIV